MLTNNELYAIAVKLHECCLAMKEISNLLSDQNDILRCIAETLDSKPEGDSVNDQV